MAYLKSSEIDRLFLEVCRNPGAHGGWGGELPTINDDREGSSAWRWMGTVNPDAGSNPALLGSPRENGNPALRVYARRVKVRWGTGWVACACSADGRVSWSGGVLTLAAEAMALSIKRWRWDRWHTNPATVARLEW